MPALTTAAAITGGSALIGNLISNSGNKKSQKRADKMNTKFWQMQNDYNDPAQQMARLKKAGLNPNLIYGQSVAGATGQAGSVAPSKAAPYSMQGIGQAAMQGYQAEAQVQNTNADTLDKIQKIGVDKKYLEPMAKAELTKMSLGNIQLYLKNQQIAPFVATAVERASEELLTIQSNTKTAQAKQKVSEFQARLSNLNINPTGSLGMTLLRMIMASVPELQQYLSPPDNQNQ
jgi:hypothetical protein